MVEKQNIQHPDNVVGWDGSIEELAESVGAMRYDKIAEFINALASQIEHQSQEDWKKGRRILSARLRLAAQDLGMVLNSFRTAWAICEPRMPKDGQ